VTYVLIALNAAVWLYQVALWATGGDPLMNSFLQRWGIVPYWLTEGAHAGSWVTLLSSMFIHGGWAHILGNMWFLWIFGDNVEDALGKVRYVIFYVICGLAAAGAQVLIDPDSIVPMVGASGAIAGVLAAYVMLYPRARVLTFVFIFFVELPAFVFIFVWFALQLSRGVGSLGSIGDNVGGVAFFAHIGGFLAGLALIKLMLPRGDRGRRVYHRPRDARRRPGEWGVDRHRPW